MKLKHKIASTFAFALIGSALLTPAAFASTGVAHISANVPQYCEITQVLNVNADFGVQSTSMTTSGQLNVHCNENQTFALTTSDTDENGILKLAHAGGGQPMDVSITTRDGILWTNATEYEGVGVGVPQWVIYNLDFNTSSGKIPEGGAYFGEMAITLTAY